MLRAAWNEPSSIDILRIGQYASIFKRNFREVEGATSGGVGAYIMFICLFEIGYTRAKAYIERWAS